MFIPPPCASFLMPVLCIHWSLEMMSLSAFLVLQHDHWVTGEDGCTLLWKVRVERVVLLLLEMMSLSAFFFTSWSLSSWWVWMYFTVKGWGGKSCSFISGNGVTFSVSFLLFVFYIMTLSHWWGWMYFTVEDWGGKSCSFTTGNDVTIIFSIFEDGGALFCCCWSCSLLFHRLGGMHFTVDGWGVKSPFICFWKWQHFEHSFLHCQNTNG